jgi:hypothetical protein
MWGVVHVWTEVDMNVLPNEIVVYVNRDIFVKPIARELAEICGGATVTKGGGYWLNGENKIVSEPVTLVSAFTDIPYDLLWSCIRPILYKYLKQGAQDAVMISFNGQAIILSGIPNNAPSLVREKVTV